MPRVLLVLVRPSEDTARSGRNSHHRRRACARRYRALVWAAVLIVECLAICALAFLAAIWRWP